MEIEESTCLISEYTKRVRHQHKDRNLNKWKHWSFSFSISPSNKQSSDLLQNELVGSPCSPTDSQESSPIPQFRNINSLMLSFLHSPNLTSIHGHWENHRRGQMVLCWQSYVCAFEYTTFLPRSKRLLFSWLQSPYSVILEPPKMKSDLFPLFLLLFAMK